jgi:DNA polymerase I-like protein with 3'-5' exonuclease and polymerase domains
MRIIDTNTTTTPGGIFGEWVYNGSDSCLTREILDVLLTKKEQNSDNVYGFSRALQAPALAMMRRGVLVDQKLKMEYIETFSDQLDELETFLNRMSNAIWEKNLNARSSVQLQSFFYDVMNLKKIYVTVKGEKKLPMNREVLEKLSEDFYAEPIIKTILKIRDLSKLISVLETNIDFDGRMRVSYNIAGTETGRWSSSKSVFNRGTNFQNITPAIRDIFIADPGKKLCYADLEQAESRVVAYESEDEAYIEACEHGDLHTMVAKMVFSIDESSVRSPYYRHFSFRDIAKRAGHATNYGATPFTLSSRLKLPLNVCKEFQHLYFQAFPGIRRWHHDIQVELQTQKRLTTCLGRSRQFFNRSYTDETLREAIAYKPQSTVGDILNMGLLSIYNNHEKSGEVELLAQIHDAVLFQYPNDKPDSFVSAVAKRLEIPVNVKSRTMTIPVEHAVGSNWKDLH